jgi:hypothetical protein
MQSKPISTVHFLIYFLSNTNTTLIQVTEAKPIHCLNRSTNLHENWYVYATWGHVNGLHDKFLSSVIATLYPLKLTK